MNVSRTLTGAAALVAAIVTGSSALATDGAGFARTGGAAGAAASNVVMAGYTNGCAPDGGACLAGGHCSPNGSAGHGFRCACPECSDPSAFEKFCLKLGIKKREAIHDHSTWAINHYRHLSHPKCPPYCHPSWGYYQTCWSRFPEETLWCPECPSVVDAAIPLPAHGVTPVGPAVSPPPAPASPMPAPAPAPMPEPPAVEQPAYEELPYEESPMDSSADGMSSSRRPARNGSVQQASIGNFDRSPADPPRFLTPVRIGAETDFSTVPHPRNRWRLEQ